MEKLLIIKTGATLPFLVCRRGDFQDWILSGMGVRADDVMVVDVRGAVVGRPHLVIMECMDCKRPVDVQEIDKLDSKRRDLSAAAAIICSNSGFTVPTS